MKLLIDTDWATFIEDLPTEKQLEFFWAVFDYGNHKCSLKCWNKIQPVLEKGKIGYYNKLKNLKHVSDTIVEPTIDSTIDSMNEPKPVSIVERGNVSVSKRENINTRNNTSNLSTTRTKENQIANQNEKTRVHNALEIFGNSFKATDAVVDIFDRPDGTTKHGIRIKNQRLMAFVRQRFDQTTLNKVSDWAIDHNQRGHTYNASALLKLLCKFQSNIEPSINYNSVQAQYLSFEYTAVGGTK